MEGHKNHGQIRMIQPESELAVITVTAQTTINLSGRTINIGPHCITFSGVAVLAYPDGTYFRTVG